ncbi:MAG TPA: FAD-dependent monooxygenase [Candidatus Methylomirabilis sp.]
MGDLDALVVGAGPAGCAAAVLLAQAGRRVLLLDKSAVPPPKVCGEYLSPGCLRLLARLGVVDAVEAAGARPLAGMLIHTARGRVLQARYTPDAGSSICGLSLPRSRLDPLLQDAAQRAGVRFQGGFQASDLLWESGRVVGVAGRERGAWTSYRAEVVVGADGRHSAIASRMGGRQRHPWLDRMALVGYFSGARREKQVGEIFLGRDRYAILNPIGRDLTNIGLVADRRALPRGEDPRRQFRSLVDSLPGLAPRLTSARAVAPIRCLGPLAYRANRLAVPGALLVGDAAGFLDPFTGEGIHAALRSAELAAICILHQKSEESGNASAPYAAAWTREFVAKWRFLTALQVPIRHPWLAERLIVYLGTRPALTARLMAAAGDLVPSNDLTLHRLLAPGRGSSS